MANPTKPKYTPNEVLEKVAATHGPYYVFPRLIDEYQSSRSPLTVLCPIHGPFMSTFAKLVYHKTGCPECGQFRAAVSTVKGPEFAKESLIRIRKFVVENWTRENKGRPDISINSLYEMVEGEPVPAYEHKRVFLTGAMARKLLEDIHGDVYTFPNVEKEYLGVRYLITGICPLHGEFKVDIDSVRSRGYGCRSCGYMKANYTKAYGKEEGRRKVKEQLLQAKREKDENDRRGEVGDNVVLRLPAE